jgi:site-specific recombinase XerD
MATVYRKTYTMIMPKNVEIVQRDGQSWAKWTDCNGKKHLDPTTVGRRGQLKIVRFAPTFFAQYRDADGQMVIESTGCRDEQAARHVLAERVKRVEHIKAGILNPQQCRTADHARSALQEHVDSYLEHLQAKTIRGKRVSQGHRDNVERQLNILLNDCHFKRLMDITRDAMEKWMNRMERQEMGPRTRNTYRAAIIAFCNWCVETDRMAANPLSRLCSADEHADRRKTRRAMTEEELGRLFIAARLRPLAEYGRVTVKVPHPSGRKTWQKEPLCFDTLHSAVQNARGLLKLKPRLIESLEWEGRERALIYKILVLTGLRKGELASITLGQLWLDEKHPYLELKAKDEKSGRGAQIPLRNDMVADIRQYLSEKKQHLHLTALLAQMPLFDMPRSMVGLFDRDLAAAGIAKRDERGRTLDVHALRHTFGTHLSKAGVTPRVAQAAMRHSTLNLTMNIYTDPTLLDVNSAINALPRLDQAALAKTGT